MASALPILSPPNTPADYTTHIDRLKSHYEAYQAKYPQQCCIMYNESALESKIPGNILTNGFLGSKTVLKLDSGHSMIGYSLGCFAAPHVSLRATHIELGTPRKSTYPFRLFSPLGLEIYAQTVVLDNLDIVEPKPLMGRITCAHLTLFKDPADATPPLFDLIKGWIQGTPTIEIKSRTCPALSLSKPAPVPPTPFVSEADVLAELAAMQTT
jgi:hypothetical protein